MTTRNFVSSGDPEEDARIAQGIELHEERMSRGICPNGCGPMVLADPYNQDCPKCGFHQWSNVPTERENQCLS